METLGPAPQQAEEFLQLDEEEWEEEGERPEGCRPTQAKKAVGTSLVSQWRGL